MRGQSTARLLLAAAALGYGWWASGIRSFTTAGYLVVLIPAIALGLALIGTTVRAQTPVGTAKKSARPWFATLLASVALESVGLALGGRSSLVPTLSDVVDRGLVHHAVRAVAFAIWLAIGVAIGAQRSRRLNGSK